MLLGILGILGGGRDGPYSYGYFAGDALNSIYSNNTPQQALDWPGYYFTYTLGEALTADGSYSNYYFVEGQIDTAYTNLHTAVTAINVPNIEYLYRDGTAEIAPQHTVKVNLSSLSTSYWLSANPEGMHITYDVNLEFYGPYPARYKVYTKSNNLEEVPDYPVEPMQGAADLIKDDEISGELYQGQYPEDFSDKVALWAIRQGYFVFSYNPFTQYVIHRLEKEGDNFTTKFYSSSTKTQGIGTSPLHTSSANTGNIASNLRGQNYYVDSNNPNSLWVTDNDGYFSTYAHQYQFPLNNSWYTADLLQNGTKVYASSNTWSYAPATSGFGNDASSNDWQSIVYWWEINQQGSFDSNYPPYRATWVGMDNPVWAAGTSGNADNPASDTVYATPFGGAPNTGTFTYNNPANNRNYEYTISFNNPVYYIDFLKFPYVLQFSDDTQTAYELYFSGINGSLAYPERYSHLGNFPPLNNNIYAHSDINGDGLIEDWMLNENTAVVSWTNQYISYEGHSSCEKQENQKVRVFTASNQNSLIMGIKLYWDNNGEYTNIYGALVAYSNKIFVPTNSNTYYVTDSAGFITTIEQCGY